VIQQSTVIHYKCNGATAASRADSLIARTAATRMAGVTYPQRLYHNANVYSAGHRKANYTGRVLLPGWKLLGTQVGC